MYDLYPVAKCGQENRTYGGITLSERLLEKIKTRKAHIAVLGLGHVGLPTAAIFANTGYSVTGADVKKEVVDSILSLKLDTKEPGLGKMIERNVKAGKLKAIADTVLATKQAEVMLICVQTPLTQSGKPDLRYLENVSRDVARGLAKGKLVIVVSTVPPGTVKNLVASMLEKESGLKCGADFWLAYSPERILPGNTIEEFVTNVRLVGGFDARSAELAVELFKKVTKGTIQVTDIVNAELAKLAENTFRYVNIAFANDLALMCQKMGADVIEVINLANTHPRVNIHKPGPGVGGPCLTKDPQLLLHPMGHSPFTSKLIECSKELNDYMAEHVIKLVVKALKDTNRDVKNSDITVLGIAYKAEVSDTTNSPAEKIIRKLISLGAKVRVYDPYTKENFGAKSSKSITEAVKGTDCIVVATDHKAFEKLDFRAIKRLMNTDPIIVDGRRVIDPGRARKQGFTYYGIGYGS